MNKRTFGEFVKGKRLEKGISLREFAKLLGKFPSYICDIEKDRRHPVERDFLSKIAEVLELSAQETSALFDLSTQDRTEYAPPDLSELINATPYLGLALRTARDANLTDEEWREICELIQNVSKRCK